MTFEELVAKSIQRGDDAETSLATALELHRDPKAEIPPATVVLLQSAATNALLAEAYARLASAVIVNRTSLQHASIVQAEQSSKRGPVS